MAGSAEGGLRSSLAHTRFQTRELFGLIETEERQALARAAEEKVAQEALIKSLEQSQDILKKEKKKIKTELQAALQAATAAAAAARKDAPPLAPSGSGAAPEPDADVVDLQTKLIDLNNRLLDIDFELKAAATQLAQGTRPGEKDLLCVKVVVMQDTKRILNAEIDALRSNIFRIETAAKAEADKRAAEETGFTALRNVEEQLQRTAARIDALKQAVYFPAAKGYRFSGGSAGVYVAAQDLFLSELSGRVTITCQKITRQNGTAVAQVSVTVEGASDSRGWSESSGAVTSPSTAGSMHHSVSSEGSLLNPASHANPLRFSKSSSHLVRAAGEHRGVSPRPVGHLPPLRSAAASDGVVQSSSLTPHAPSSTPSTPTVPEHSSDPQPPPVHPSIEAGTAVSMSSLALDRLGDESLAPAPALPPLLPPIATDLDLASPGAVTTPGAADTPPSAPELLLHPFASPTAAPAGQVSVAVLAADAAAASPTGSASQQLVAVPSVSNRSLASHPSSRVSAGNAASRGMSPRASQAGEPISALNGTPVGESAPPAQQAQQRLAPRVSDSSSVSFGAKTPVSPASTGRGLRLPRTAAAAAPPKKGELMSGFLNSITSKSKGTFKGLLAGGGSGNSSPQAAPALPSPATTPGAAPSGMLTQRMGKLREGLGSHLKEGFVGLGSHMKEGIGGLGGRVDRMREGLGTQMDRVKESLVDGVQDGKGRLNKLAAAIGPKALSGSPAGQQKQSGLFTRKSGDRSSPSTPVVKEGDPSAASPFLSTSLAQAVVDANAAADAKPAEPNLARRSNASDTAGPSARGVATSGSGLTSGPAEPALGVAFEPFGRAPQRRGLYVKLLGDKVALVGERGTKVPDMSASEIMLEVEVGFSATLEWTALDGWQVPDSQPLDLNILQLDHRMRGNTLPLPRAALKGLLNVFLPGLVKGLLLSTLPPELGQYVIASGEDLQLRGEFQVRGPALDTYVAPVAGPVGRLPSDPAKRSEWQAVAAAAGRARQLLGLTEAQALALSQLFHGPHALLDPPRTASICELCRLAATLSASKLWGPLIGQLNKALQALLELHGVPPSERFTFGGFMEGPVARLVRKPLQIAFMIDTLKVHVDVDAALNTLHDLLERLTRDLHKRAQRGDEGVEVPSEPLEVQLSALQGWHAELVHTLRSFKARFKAASCSLLVAADREVFQFGAEGVTYDGPMRLRVPLEVLVDPDHSFVIDVRLPKKDTYVSNITSLLQEVMDGLASVAEGGATQEESQVLQQQLEGIMRRTQSSGGAAGGTGPDGDGGAALPAADGGGSFVGPLPVPPPALQDAVIGQLFIKKLAVALRLDEERLGELMEAAASGSGPATGTSTPGGGRSTALSTLLGCYGDLFSMSLDVGWRPDNTPDALEGATKPACMLTVANNEVTRVMTTLEALMFQSCVSPQVAISVLATVMHGIMTRYYPEDSYQVTFWQRLFRQLHEYLARDALRVLGCVSARLELVKPPADSSGAPPHAPTTSGLASTADDMGPAPSKLRLTLLGETVRSSGAASPDPGTSGDVGSTLGSAKSGAPAPVAYLINEVNLLTLLDSVTLFMGPKEE